MALEFDGVNDFGLTDIAQFATIETVPNAQTNLVQQVNIEVPAYSNDGRVPLKLRWYFEPEKITNAYEVAFAIEV